MSHFSKVIRRKARRGFRGYPLGTVALYGPNDRLATKVAVGIVLGEDDEPSELRRWRSGGEDIRGDAEIERDIIDFLREHQVKSVVMTDRIIGCPHEEGIDYPEGETCPECPFWADRDRWTGELLH